MAGADAFEAEAAAIALAYVPLAVELESDALRYCVYSAGNVKLSLTEEFAAFTI